MTANGGPLWSVIAAALQNVMRAHGREVDLYRYSEGELHRFEEIAPGVGVWRDAEEVIVAVEIARENRFQALSAAERSKDAPDSNEPHPGDRVHEGKTGFVYEVVGVGTAFETEDRIVIYRYGADHLYSCRLQRWLEAMEDGAMIPEPKDERWNAPRP